MRRQSENQILVTALRSEPQHEQHTETAAALSFCPRETTDAELNGGKQR
jgi:hypothetical protein